MNERKIIQICAVPCSENNSTIVALCNDSSLWFLAHEKNTHKWIQLPQIPQSEENIKNER